MDPTEEEGVMVERVSREGWICPRCYGSLSPDVDVCFCSFDFGPPVVALKVWSFAGVMRALHENPYQ
jgi:hypothetical protein